MKLFGVLREGTQAILKTVNRATHKGQHIGIFNNIRYYKLETNGNFNKINIPSYGTYWLNLFTKLAAVY